MRNLIRDNSRRSRSGVHLTSRIVTDRRWVHRNQLRIGMYVNELDRPWSETRFMFQGFTIDTPELLAEVQASCEYALVETEKLARIASNSPDRLVAARRAMAGSSI